MHGTTICTIRIAEVHTTRTFSITCNMHCMFHQLVNTFILCR